MAKATKTPQSTPKNDNSLSSKDLVTIIKAAKSAGIIQFKYGKLEISFEKPMEIREFSQKPSEKPGSGPIPLNHPEEDFLADLMISDPLSYEEAIEEKLQQENG